MLCPDYILFDFCSISLLSLTARCTLPFFVKTPFLFAFRKVNRCEMYKYKVFMFHSTYLSLSHRVRSNAFDFIESILNGRLDDSDGKNIGCRHYNIFS